MAGMLEEKKRRLKSGRRLSRINCWIESNFVRREGSRLTAANSEDDLRKVSSIEIVLAENSMRTIHRFHVLHPICRCPVALACENISKPRDAVCLRSCVRRSGASGPYSLSPHPSRPTKIHTIFLTMRRRTRSRAILRNPNSGMAIRFTTTSATTIDF